jgi:hypothetical protein
MHADYLEDNSLSPLPEFVYEVFIFDWETGLDARE